MEKIFQSTSRPLVVQKVKKNKTKKIVVLQNDRVVGLAFTFRAKERRLWGILVQFIPFRGAHFTLLVVSFLFFTLAKKKSKKS